MQVNISVAIIPMAQDFGWSPTVSGLVQSSFFWGYALSQIPGGYLNSNIGGRRVLPTGVGLWSAATAAVPLVGGFIPGAMRQTRAGPSLLTSTPCCCRLLSARLPPRTEIRAGAVKLVLHEARITLTRATSNM
jgi:MFS transporter, ACS family, solute carrier family 17 (sodium-dependent inorganic phosphate cotransporter), other